MGNSNKKTDNLDQDELREKKKFKYIFKMIK